MDINELNQNWDSLTTDERTDILSRLSSSEWKQLEALRTPYPINSSNHYENGGYDVDYLNQIWGSLSVEEHTDIMGQLTNQEWRTLEALRSPQQQVFPTEYDSTLPPLDDLSFPYNL